ncbi:MAG: NAD(P)-binding domain-containing protein, partial [Bacteroidales bacterium]|nr:NAD(P)-binding domain-containing protein [Bacteroidales bacterium]
MKIILIGTGNIAWQFGHRLHNKQIPIYGVYGRTPAKARELATQWKSKAYSDLQKLPDDADIYLFALSDHAYPDVIRDFPHRNKTKVHT